MELNLSKEIIFASDDVSLSKKISTYEKNGKLRKIAPRLYTSNMIDSPANIVRRNIIEIIGWRLPGSLLSHKSASMLKPTEKGNLYITSTFTKRISELPGVVLNVMKGRPPLESDIVLGSSGIYVSSEYRWMLEVMQPARKGKDGEIKSFSNEFIEQRLEAMIKAGGEARVNAFRDKTREIAEQLGMQKEFQKLSDIISALLATHNESILLTASGKARAAGTPVDTVRIELFEKLYDRLEGMYFPDVPDKNITEDSFRLFSFFESYFSNYIEGTEFEISEAKQIVDTGIVLPKRTADSHDILGTFRLLSNRQEMQRIPQNEDELLSILRFRHSVLLEGRPDCSPGMFKTLRNRAGNTEFVEPTLVEGTLRYGFRLYHNLKEPLAKAVFMMFMCSEVHPFTDGNGRVSRVMMNADLVRAGQVRIIVPTVFREDYILALRKLSRSKEPDTYINVLVKLQAFSKNLFGEDFDTLHQYLLECNAYNEPELAKLRIIDRYVDDIKS